MVSCKVVQSTDYRCSSSTNLFDASSVEKPHLNDGHRGDAAECKLGEHCRAGRVAGALSARELRATLHAEARLHTLLCLQQPVLAESVEHVASPRDCRHMRVAEYETCTQFN